MHLNSTSFNQPLNCTEFMATTGMPNETWRGAVVPVSKCDPQSHQVGGFGLTNFQTPSPHLIILIFAEVSPCFTMFHHVSPFPGGPQARPMLSRRFVRRALRRGASSHANRSNCPVCWCCSTNRWLCRHQSPNSLRSCLEKIVSQETKFNSK